MENTYVSVSLIKDECINEEFALISEDVNNNLLIFDINGACFVFKNAGLKEYSFKLKVGVPYIFIGNNKVVEKCVVRYNDSFYLVSIELDINEFNCSNNVVIKSEEELRGLSNSYLSKVSFLDINGTIWNYRNMFENIQDETSNINGDKILISIDNGNILIQRIINILYKKDKTFEIIYSILRTYSYEEMESIVRTKEDIKPLMRQLKQ